MAPILRCLARCTEKSCAARLRTGASFGSTPRTRVRFPASMPSSLARTCRPCVTATPSRTRPVSATDTIRFVGHALAAVAADTSEIAEQALAAITVERRAAEATVRSRGRRPRRTRRCCTRNGKPTLRCRSLPVKATLPGARGCTWRCRCSVRGVVSCLRASFHDVTAAPRLHRAADGGRRLGRNGNVTVWSNTQLPFDTQNTLAEILELPAARIRVVVPGIGGGFGGKLRIGVEHFAALLARLRPGGQGHDDQRGRTDRAHPRQATIVTLKTGVTEDGRLLAREGSVLVDCGAYSGSGPGTGAVALQCLVGPYRTPNLRLERSPPSTRTRCRAARFARHRDRWRISPSSRRWT